MNLDMGWKKIFKVGLAGISFFIFVFSASAYAGQMQVDAPVPSPYGEYLNTDSTESAYFATTSGVVGIGTINPGTKLHAVAPNWGGILNLDAGANAATQKQAMASLITLGNGATGLGNAATKGWAIMGRGDGYTTASEQNDLLVTYWTGASWQPGLYIDSLTGNVGIGTNVPTDIAGTATSDVTIAGSIIQDGWTAATLLNAWVSYGAPFSPPGFFRDKSGIVHLRGLVRSGTMAAPIFVLPVGYRPAGRELIYNLAYTTGYVLGRVDIDTAGAVIAQNGGNTFYQLDGITFRASGY